VWQITSRVGFWLCEFVDCVQLAKRVFSNGKHLSKGRNVTTAKLAQCVMRLHGGSGTREGAEVRMRSNAVCFSLVAAFAVVGCSSQVGTVGPTPDIISGEAQFPHELVRVQATAAGDASSDTADASDPTACIGSSLLTSLGKTRMLVGATMTDASAVAAPFDFRYIYIAGGLFDSSSVCSSCATNCTSNGVSCANSGPGCAWWGCWQSDQQAPGQYARDFFTKVEGDNQIPMITYDVLLEASGVQEGTAEATQAATSVSFMTRYFADWRLLLQSIGNATAFLHIEPDFWGYAEQASSDPHAGAAVATANPTDCATQPNSIAGMGNCMIAMTRKYAPNAKVGLHASSWSTGVEVAYNTNTSLDVVTQAQTTGAYLSACGANVSDFVVVEVSDRDAGYYQSIGGANHWWDATNTTLPDFTQDFTWLKALAETTNMPLLEWQIPIGNMSLTNVTGAWKDNRVDYFFAHMADLAAAHVFAIAYGAGASGMTTPETDGGNLLAKTTAYASGGGQLLCP
jgi:hypothetical protein